MLLQTNSYVVPKDKRTEHTRLLHRFKAVLARIGCDHFEAYEQTGANWGGADHTGRFVQIMRFRDRQHQLAVQQAERTDPQAQQLVKEFCELINLPYQQQTGLFAVGYYNSVIAASVGRAPSATPQVKASGLVAPAAADLGEDVASRIPPTQTESNGQHDEAPAEISLDDINEASETTDDDTALDILNDTPPAQQEQRG